MFTNELLWSRHRQKSNVYIQHRETCMSSISIVIYHKFSYGIAFYMLNGKNVNIMLVCLLEFFGSGYFYYSLGSATPLGHLILGVPNKNCSRRHFLIFYFYLSKKIRLDSFMWILCLVEDSLETSSLIFSEKQRKNIYECRLLQSWLAL